MSPDDEARLRHMLDAAREAISFAKGRKSGDLNLDRMLLLSLVKELEIIGEAAARMSTEARSAIPGVPWRQVITMRNPLTHAYFDWDADTIWLTVTGDLPGLVVALERAHADEP